ncbi:MAG: I78 family peptidase inhibitor [Pseudoxanthomonas sp.]
MPSMIATAILSLALSACVQAPVSGTAAAPSEHVSDPTASIRCDASKANAAIGQLSSSYVLEAARKAAGAEIVRTLPQGQLITKEFRVGRLNLVLDREGRIASANCS